MFEFKPFNAVIASRYFYVYFDLQSLWPKNWKEMFLFVFMLH